ncbi:unnamed protein product, partial [Musa acuminata var. zebrina]
RSSTSFVSNPGPTSSTHSYQKKPDGYPNPGPWRKLVRVESISLGRHNDILLCTAELSSASTSSSSSSTHAEYVDLNLQPTRDGVTVFLHAASVPVISSNSWNANAERSDGTDQRALNDSVQEMNPASSGRGDRTGSGESFRKPTIGRGLRRCL